MEGHTPPTDGAPDGAPLVIEVNADTRGRGQVFAPGPMFDLTVRMEVPPWAHHDTEDVVGPVDPGTWAQRLALTVIETMRREPLNVVDELRDQDRRIDQLTEAVGQLQQLAAPPVQSPVDADDHQEADDAPGGANDPDTRPPDDDHPF